MSLSEKDFQNLRILTGEYHLYDRPSLDQSFVAPEANTSVAENYVSRISSIDFPFLLMSLCRGIGYYVSAVTKVGRFVDVHLQDVPDLFVRINLCTDSEEYCANYSSEIALIKKVASACYDYANDYQNDAQSKVTFDAMIFSAVREYIHSPNTITKRFLR